jgi:hypothetical protein
MRNKQNTETQKFQRDMSILRKRDRNFKMLSRRIFLD